MSFFATSPVCRALGVVLLANLAGCAGKRAAPPPEIAAESLPADPNQALNDLGTRLQNAQAGHVDLLSPQNFAKAKEAYKDAERTRSESKEAYNPDIMKKVREGEAYLSQALKTAQISNQTLSQANEARQKAVEAGAQQNFPKDFKNADKDLISATEKIEEGDISGASKDERKLVSSYNDLEKKALRAKYLSDSSRTIESAKNEGAEKWAPKTLARAQADLNNLDIAIKQNPRDVATLEKLASNVKEEADFLLRVTRSSKTLEVKPPEARALEMEKLNKEIAASEEAATQSREQQMASAEELQKMQKQVEQTRRLEALAKAFSPDEAEVIRRDNQLVIHLKALDFPKAKSSIPSSDYALLNKLGDILAQAGPEAKVIVQGNTDSTGSASANQKISEKRAEAVRDYLVSARSIPSEQIEAKGMGYSKPIASNKTAEGRRLNRRVDVIIQEVATS